jgi:hypothetical protein
MKFRWIAAILIIALALGAGCIAYVCMREPMPEVAANDGDALLWLRHEFKLPADKMARIEKMHDAYQVVCEEHCRIIRDARVGLRKLREAKAPAAEITAAEEKSKEVDLICTTSLETHMREIASVMGGEDGRRYLSIVLPRVAKFDHAGAPGLDFESAKPHAGHAKH